MLEDIDYYIDPDETEVFFGPVTKYEIEAFKRKRGAKSNGVPVALDFDDDKENVTGNVKLVDSRKPLKYDLPVFQKPHLKENEIDKADIITEKNSETIHNTTPSDILDMVNSVETSIHNTTPCEINPSSDHSPVEENPVSTHVSIEETLVSAANSLEDHVENNAQEEKSTRVSGITKCLSQSFSRCDITMADIDEGDISESLEWLSTDVNVLLESITANICDLTFDENEPVVTSFADKMSSTPLQSPRGARRLQQSPICVLDVTGSAHKHDSVKASPRIPLMLPKACTPTKYYTKSMFQEDREDRVSSSTDSFNSCESPKTPFRKPTALNIPKKASGSKRMICSEMKLKPAAECKEKSVASASRVRSRLPVKSGNALKAPAAKSLQFSHIQSPIQKYIHQRSIPIVRNFAEKKTVAPSNANVAPLEKTKPQSFAEIKPVVYQQGKPHLVEKPSLSRLPRLGPNQMTAIKPLSPRVVKHVAKINDVSMMVSAEAKGPGGF